MEVKRSYLGVCAHVPVLRIRHDPSIAGARSLHLWALFGRSSQIRKAFALEWGLSLLKKARNKRTAASIIQTKVGINILQQESSSTVT